jgi:uncharacterized protein
MQTLSRTSQTLLALAAIVGAGIAVGPAHSQEAPRSEQRTIRVMGTGEARATPDQAHIDLAVETFAETAREAGEENARIMERVIQALVAAGVPRAEIETRGYSLFPEYTPQPRPTQEQPRIRGYRASNMVTIRTSDLARVGPLIDTALAAGANRMDSVRFSLQDDEATQSEALANAVQRARRSAETMATALGVTLGPVVDASTSTELVRPMIYGMERMAMDEAQTTPIQPREQTVSATVSLVFAIGPAGS